MIELIQASKRYSPHQYGLYRESISFPAGEVVAILGANGSGKTSMLKAIMGLGELNYGHVWVNGKPPQEQYAEMAFITEEGSYIPHMNLCQYADFLAEFYPRFDRELFHRQARLFRLDPDDKIRTFSRGQKSKLELCAGFAKGASIFLLDEPFLGNDMLARKDFVRLMLSQLQGNETVLITTHLLDEIENLVDRAVFMHQGRIQMDVYVDELREQGRRLADVLAETSVYKEQEYRKILYENDAEQVRQEGDD